MNARVLNLKQLSIENTHEQILGIRNFLNEQVLGQEEAVDLSLIAFFANGHVLLEGPPGVGKTSLANCLASVVQGSFHRIQMTSDMLPSDIFGSLRIKAGSSDLEFKPGPIFANVVLADELNRTSAKTQAALLESMAEQKVTVDGVTYPLPEPFFVLATQNPQDFQGVYPLSESQMDRFMVHIDFVTPSYEAELSLYKKYVAQKSNRSAGEKKFVDLATVEVIRGLVKNVFVEDSILVFVQQLVHSTRALDDVLYGASIRATLQLLDAAKSRAFLRGRNFVIPEDIQKLAPSVLAHRICFRSLDLPASQRKELLNEAIAKLVAPK